MIITKQNIKQLYATFIGMLLISIILMIASVTLFDKVFQIFMTGVSLSMGILSALGLVVTTNIKESLEGDESDVSE